MKSINPRAKLYVVTTWKDGRQIGEKTCQGFMHNAQRLALGLLFSDSIDQVQITNQKLDLLFDASKKTWPEN